MSPQELSLRLCRACGRLKEAAGIEPCPACSNQGYRVVSNGHGVEAQASNGLTIAPYPVPASQ